MSEHCYPSFDELSCLDGVMAQTLTRMDFRDELQEEALRLALFGKDVILESKWQSGKTTTAIITALRVIFGLTLQKGHPQVLFLSPTRDAALTTTEMIRTYEVSNLNVKVKAFIGGSDLQGDWKHIRDCSIAVGTPGRVRQLMQQKNFKAKNLRLIVLDEIDKMLINNQDFLDDLTAIFSFSKSKKQVIATAAKISDFMLDILAEKFMMEPVVISYPEQEASFGKIEHFQHIIQNCNERNNAVISILDDSFFSKCIIFAENPDQVQTLESKLNIIGYKCCSAFGNIDLKSRLVLFKKFNKNACQVLIVDSNVVLKGMFVKHVDLVVNMSLPRDQDLYHRRTAVSLTTERRVVSIVSQEEPVLLSGYSDVNLKPWNSREENIKLIKKSEDRVSSYLSFIRDRFASKIESAVNEAKHPEIVDFFREMWSNSDETPLVDETDYSYHTRIEEETMRQSFETGELELPIFDMNERRKRELITIPEMHEGSKSSNDPQSCKPTKDRNIKRSNEEVNVCDIMFPQHGMDWRQQQEWIDKNLSSFKFLFLNPCTQDAESTVKNEESHQMNN